MNRRTLYSTLAIAASLAGGLFFINGETSSSARTEKFLTLKRHSHDRSPANYNKARAPIYVSISRIDDGSDTKLIRLQGSVKALRDFQNVKVVWALPTDVQIISGSAELNTSIASGETQKFEVLVSSSTLDNRQIHFHASNDEVDGERFGATAQYNTTKQEIIAKQLKENFLKAREKVRAGELRKIIF